MFFVLYSPRIRAAAHLCRLGTLVGTLASFWPLSPWDGPMKCREIIFDNSKISPLGLYPHHLTMYFFRPRSLCATMRSTAYTDGDVEVLLPLTGVFFLCCCCVAFVLLLSKPGICAVLRGCSLSPGAAIIMCIDTIFATPSSSSKTVCGCFLMIWKSLAFCSMALAVSLSVFALLVSDGLSSNTHWSKQTIVWRRFWHHTLVCTEHPDFAT